MLSRNSPKPLYIQLEELFRSAIAQGEWAPGEAIPSENELVRRYGVSRMTVRSVITTLVQEGLLYRIQGKGTFVCEPKISAISPAYVGIREQLESQGYTIDTRLVTFEIIPSDHKLSRQLSVPAHSDILHIKRVRYADSLPVSIHESFIPRYLCPTLEAADIDNEQLCVALEQGYHLTPDHTHETLESVLSTEEEASLLEIEAGHPLLLMKETNRSMSGLVFEYSKIVFRGDKICLEFDYHQGSH